MKFVGVAKERLFKEMCVNTMSATPVQCLYTQALCTMYCTVVTYCGDILW